jgi:hypothetical protein
VMAITIFALSPRNLLKPKKSAFSGIQASNSGDTPIPAATRTQPMLSRLPVWRCRCCLGTEPR